MTTDRRARYRQRLAYHDSFAEYDALEYKRRFNKGYRFLEHMRTRPSRFVPPIQAQRSAAQPNNVVELRSKRA